MGNISRRDFLIQGGIWASCVAALSAAPLGLWHQLFSIGSPKKSALKTAPALSLKQLKQKSILETEISGKPIILIHDGKNTRALSAICTHAQCTVKWNESEKLLVCPCHDGAYDLKGQVQRHPPIRPLSTYVTQIQGDRISIQL